MPPPPAPACPGTGEFSYPIGGDDDNEVSAYPVDDDDAVYDVPYPTDGMDHPATGTYPEFSATSTVDDGMAEYPAVGAYPSECGADGYDDVVPQDPSTASPPKKKVKIDKALVALLPSHVQKNRQSTICKKLR